MGRTLSGASYDRNDYVLQPHNGGSGCASIEELKERYGLIRENEFNTPGGVLAYDEKGNVPVQNLPQQLITRPSTYIKGPVSIVPGGTATYKISNYSESASYNVSFDGGTVSVEGDIITIVAGNIAGKYTLKINNEKYELAVSTDTPSKPKIEAFVLKAGTSSNSTVNSNIELASNIPSGSTLLYSEFQIASDSYFNEILATARELGKNSTAIINIPKSQKYYIRGRVTDSFGQNSEWSEYVSFDYGTLSNIVATPTVAYFLNKTTDGVEVTLMSSRFYSIQSGNFAGMDIQVSESPSFSTLVYSNSFQDLSALMKVRFSTTAQVLYFRARHAMEGNIYSGWSEVFSSKVSDLFSNETIVPVMMAHSSKSTSRDYLGRNIAMNHAGTVIVTCAPWRENSTGHAEVYFKNKSGNWDIGAVLSEPDKTFEGSQYATDVTMSSDGRYFALSAPCIGIPSSSRIHQAAIFIYEIILGTVQLIQVIENPSDTPESDFGYGVAASDDFKYLAVSSYFKDNAAVPEKIVIYKFINGRFEFSSDIIAPAGVVASDRFGMDVCISGDSNYLFAGAPKKVNEIGGNGAFYIYKRTDDNWNLIQTVLNPNTDATDTAVSISCSTDAKVLGIVNSFGVGSTLIYSRTGDVFSKIHEDRVDAGLTVNASRPGSIAVSPDGLKIITGYYYSGNGVDGTPGYYTGSVRKIENKSGVWTANNYVYEAGERFNLGRSVACNYDGSVVVAGASANYPSAYRQGSVIIFRAQNKAYERYQFIAPTSSVGDTVNNGASMTISSDGTIVASGSGWSLKTGSTAAFGRVYIFRKVDNVWSLYQTIESPASEVNAPLFGSIVSVSADSSVLLIAAERARPTTGSVAYNGAVFIYTRTDGQYTLAKTIRNPILTDSNAFGGIATISRDGTRIFIGTGRSGVIITRPSLYIYRKEATDWVLETEMLFSNTDTNTSGRRGICNVAVNRDATKMILTRSDQNLNLYEIYTRVGTTWTKQDSNINEALASAGVKEISITTHVFSADLDAGIIAVCYGTYMTVLSFSNFTNFKTIVRRPLSGDKDVPSSAFYRGCRLFNNGKNIITHIYNGDIFGTYAGRIYEYKNGDYIEINRFDEYSADTNKLGRIFAITEDGKTVAYGEYFNSVNSFLE